MMKNKFIIIVIASIALVAIYFLQLNVFSNSNPAQSIASNNQTDISTQDLASPSPGNLVSAPSLANTNTTISQEKMGLTFSNKNPEGRIQWADSLSRNPYERQSRLDDLKYAISAEVIEFPSLDSASLKLSSDTYNPTMISLPSGAQGQVSVAILANNIQADGNGNITGTLAGDPASSVVIGFHDGETSGMIESADKVYFYDAYDGKAVIIRELDADKYRASLNDTSDEREDHSHDAHE
jgi:hypothetical protein